MLVHMCFNSENLVPRYDLSCLFSLVSFSSYDVDNVFLRLSAIIIIGSLNYCVINKVYK
ncbi:hypothetical protein NMCA_09680 [Enterobacter ludwigii]|nr:hypothetical protein NMCA_09680 [Enterobacter ludwigii]